MKQPNRIAALSGTAGGIVAVLLALLGAVDTDRKAAVLIAALILVAVIVAVFLIGSQKWEALIFRQATGTPDQTVQVSSDPPPTKGDTEHELTVASREWIADSTAARAAAAMQTDEGLDGAYLSDGVPEDAIGLKGDPA